MSPFFLSRTGRHLPPPNPDPPARSLHPRPHSYHLNSLRHRRRPEPLGAYHGDPYVLQRGSIEEGLGFRRWTGGIVGMQGMGEGE